MQNWLRGFGIGCIALLVILSLLPAHDMIRTGAPKAFEHFMAYCLTALFLGLGFGRRTAWMLGLVLVGTAGLMEGLQHFSPGRTPHLSDFLASASGALFGVTLSGVYRLVRARVA